jgi:YadA-like membrane anchor domain
MKFNKSKIFAAAIIAISSCSAFAQQATATQGGTTSDRQHAVTADSDNSGDGGVWISSENATGQALGSYMYFYDAEGNSILDANNNVIGNRDGHVVLGGSRFLVETATTLINSPTTINSTLNVTSATTTNGMTNNNGFTQTGAASINTSGTAATILGANGNVTNLNSSINNIGTGAYATTNTIGSSQATNVIIGATSINANNNAATNINTGTSNSPVTVGNGLNTTNLSSAINNIGVSDNYATTNRIGTGGAFSTNILGNTNENTSVTAIAGNASQVLNNISANTTMAAGTSGLAALVGTPNLTTTGQVLLSNTAGTTVDANGKILTNGATGYVNPEAPTAAVTLTNGYGNTHGLVVTESQTTLSGGTESSSMTLTDRAATFSNAQTGAPITVTGVADGRADFDAVNVRQFAGAIAAVAAQANIPALAAGQERTFGVGVGNFMGKSALAMGMSIRGNNNSVYKATVSSGLNYGMKQTVVGVGGAWGF